MIEFAKNVLEAPLGKTYLFSVGQAGYIVKSSSGQLLGIDLYLSDCVEQVEGHKGFKRLLPRILSPDEIVFSVIVASHFHKDHFDDDAIPVLMCKGETKLFAARDCEADVERLQINKSNVTFVKPGDEYEYGDFNLKFVCCDHGDGAPMAVGVIVEVDGKRLFETGDTCLRTDWIDEFAGYGPFDILIAPINGMYGNLDEKDCAFLANCLKPKVTIPCHYGMFASHMGNPGLFYNIMKEKYPDNTFILMAQGEEYVIE